MARRQAGHGIRDPEDDWRLTRTSCLGVCVLAPAVQVFPSGRYYGRGSPDGVAQAVEQHLQNPSRAAD